MTALGPGVRVKCIYEGLWFNFLGEPCPGPRFGSVWTISEVIPKAGQFIGPFIKLHGWIEPERPMDPKWFVPLDGNEDISALEGALKKGPVERDAPARKRELERAK